MIALTGWLLLVHLTEIAGWGCLFLEGLYTRGSRELQQIIETMLALSRGGISHCR